MIPEGWKNKKLTDFATVTSGGTPSRKNSVYWNGDILWVTTGEILFNTILDTQEKITLEGLKNSSAKLFPKGTLLIAMYGQGITRGKIAKLGIEASTNQACAAIMFKKGYDSEFYFQYFYSQYENLRKIGNASTQKNLNATLIKAIRTPVPPLFEQRKIARILSTWDKAIDVTEKLIKNSQAQKKALMQQLLLQKIRFKDDSGNELPEWKNKKLIDVASFKKGKGISKADVVENGKTKCIRYGELYTSYQELAYEIYSSTDLSAENLEIGQYDDVIIPSSGETAIDIATATCVRQGGVAYSGDITVIRSNVDGLFLSYYLNSAKKGEIARLSQGSSVIHLYATHLKSLKVEIPCKQEQQKIVEVLSSSDKEIELLQKKLNFLNQEKKALMQQLLTGKRRVKVDKKEGAAA